MLITNPNDLPKLIEAEMIRARNINWGISRPKLRVIITGQAVAVSGFLTDDWAP